MCNGQESSNWSAGKFFVLTADITLNSGVLTTDDDHGVALAEGGEFRQWEPIGIYDAAHSREFQGTFDGAHHTISGLYYSAEDSESKQYVGLFGGTHNAVVRDLVIADAYVRGLKYVGALVGNSTNCTISNITATAFVTASNGYCAIISGHDGKDGTTDGSTFNGCTSNGYALGGKDIVGGIVGYGIGTIQNCTNNAEVYCTANTNNIQSVCGGIAGRLRGNVTGCVNNGYIHAAATQNSDDYNCRGGIIGVGNVLTATDCINNGPVEGAYRTGGIVGKSAANTNVAIENCQNNGTVTGTGYLGGIIGSHNGKLGITNCRNNATATITVNGGGSYAGGIAGYFYSNGTGISGCYNYAPIEIAAAAQYVGGIVGYTNKSITNCENHGTVKTNTDGAALNSVGGIAGFISGSPTISSNRNFGTITATGKYCGGICGEGGGTYSSNVNYGTLYGAQGAVGGIIGQSRFSGGTNNISYCRNEGDINSGVWGAGGIIGDHYMSGGTCNISACYNTGTITGILQTGGIIGNLHLTNANVTTNITVCYNYGTVSGTESVGGIVGQRKNYNNHSYTCKAYIRNCFNFGQVSGTDFVGGILGTNLSPAITNCYNCYSVAPSITATEGTNVGRLAGQLQSGATMQYCYALALADNSITLYQEDNPTAVGNNLTFNADFSFPNNTATIGESEYTNLLDALNAYSTANNLSLWRIHEGINSNYPYQVALACETPVITQDADKNYSISTATAGAELRYTVDRTQPTAQSTLYEGPFITDDNNYITAIARKPGLFDSEAATFDCFTSAFTMGDVNNDGHVYATDIVITVNRILGLNPTPFIFRAADINGDQAVTVEDVTLMAQIILGTYVAPSQVKAREGDEATLDLGATDGQIGVSVACSQALQAFQMDVALPQGVEVTGVSLPQRTSATHTLGWRVMDDGVLRVIAYSMTGAMMRVDDGPLFSVSYTTDDSVTGTDPVSIDNIRLVKLGGGAILPQSVTRQLPLGTGIVTHEAEHEAERYNLQGQKVGRGYKGIVVTRGRKVVVK